MFISYGVLCMCVCCVSCVCLCEWGIEVVGKRFLDVTRSGHKNFGVKKENLGKCLVCRGPQRQSIDGSVIHVIPKSIHFVLTLRLALSYTLDTHFHLYHTKF